MRAGPRQPSLKPTPHGGAKNSPGVGPDHITVDITVLIFIVKKTEYVNHICFTNSVCVRTHMRASYFLLSAPLLYARHSCTDASYYCFIIYL